MNLLDQQQVAFLLHDPPELGGKTSVWTEADEGCFFFFLRTRPHDCLELGTMYLYLMLTGYRLQVGGTGRLREFRPNT